jgi:hydrogenase maturation protease
MEESTKSDFSARLLCLGNDILADDAMGLRVAETLRGRLPASVDVVSSMESGLRLLDHLVGVPRVIVIDAVQTGSAPPGTIYVLREEDITYSPGPSGHYIGLFETLALGKKLDLPVAQDVLIIAVEVSDCLTLGGEMTPAVERAIPEVARRVEEMVG